jgi:phage-related protein
VKRTIVFYQTADGKCPIRDFLDALPAKAAQKVTWVLSLVEELDIIPSAYFQKLSGTEGIWECRITFGSNAYRIFCFFEKNSLIILTHGLVKKTRKTPRAEIIMAETYRKDYLSRRGEK